MRIIEEWTVKRFWKLERKQMNKTCEGEEGVWNPEKS